MLRIKPIADKAVQEQYARLCGVPYRPDDLAYAAYEEDTLLAISQFRLHESGGILDNLAFVTGQTDWEALFILARQTLNWIDLRGFHLCRCRETAGDPRLLALVGFRPQEGGELLADMTHMFDGSCGGHCSLADELKKL